MIRCQDVATTQVGAAGLDETHEDSKMAPVRKDSELFQRETSDIAVLENVAVRIRIPAPEPFSLLHSPP